MKDAIDRLRAGPRLNNAVMMDTASLQLYCWEMVKHVEMRCSPRLMPPSLPPFAVVELLAGEIKVDYQGRAWFFPKKG